mmetsp:Transcript_96124/g.244231  ORF Transcript_96124/g.244231 Transcript_96124/m.244231 type:complete len:218 (+) Transcript_96124:91-744(+)
MTNRFRCGPGWNPCSIASRVIPGARRPGLLGCRREVRDPTVLEHKRLVGIRDHTMHDRAVAIAVDVSLLALVRTTPRHAANLLARHHPVGEPVEYTPKPWYHIGSHQVDECVAQACLGLEIDGKVNEVVLAFEALVVHHLEERITIVIVRQISQHDRRAFLDGNHRFIWFLFRFLCLPALLPAASVLWGLADRGRTGRCAVQPPGRDAAEVARGRHL